MLQWQHLFPKRILDRGSGYYKAGRVHDLTETGSGYTALVQGSEEYRVEITVKDNNVRSMTCTCPYSEDGPRCKHMAAVLYAIKAEELEELKAGRPDILAEKVIYPFAPAAEGEYRYFDIAKMTAPYTIYEKTWLEAQAMVEDRSILPRITTGYFPGSGESCGKILCEINSRYYRSSAEMVFSRGRIDYLSCQVYSCDGCGSGLVPRRGRKDKVLCKHACAMLILLDQYFADNGTGDATNYSAAYMLNEYSRALAPLSAADSDLAPAEGKSVVISPRLAIEYGRAELSFKVGTVQKQYVVKDLFELTDTISARSTLQLGKQFALDFGRDRVDESSTGWYNLIAAYAGDCRSRSQSQPDYTDTAADRRAIPLYGSRLDEFFDCAEGTAVPCRLMTGSTPDGDFSLRVETGDPELAMTLRPDVDSSGVFHGVLLEGSLPELLAGAKYTYFVDRQSFNRMSPESVAAIKPLCGGSMSSGWISMRIGRGRLTEFYQNVLPVLREHVTVAELDPETIDRYLPGDLAFAFYLDNDRGLVTCRPEAVYGDMEYNLVSSFSGAAPADSFRNKMKERQVYASITPYFDFPDLMRGELGFSAEDDDRLFALMSGGLELLNSIGRVYCTDRFSSSAVRRTVPVKIGVSLESDVMNLEFSSGDVSLAELAEILESYRLKKKYHRLKNGDFVSMDDAIADLSELMESLRISPKEFVKGKMDIPAYRALYLDKMLEQGTELYFTRDRHYRNLIKEFKTVSDADFELPESLAGIMRPYQVYAHKWLRTLAAYGFGGILADDMGLGKTLQMISVLLSARESGDVGTSLVVCPASLVYNWLDELSRFAPSLSACAVAGAQSERAEILAHYAKYDVLVTSYDLLKRDCDKYEDIYFLYCVIDEAQFIKNHSTAASKAVKIIKSRWRFALTGTPIENRLSELWSIFDFLMPGFLYGYETFKSELETPIVKHGDAAASERLRKLVSPFILRRLKDDVLKDLPAKTEEPRRVRLEGEQQKLYDAQVAKMKQLISGQDDESFKKNKIAVLAELTRIREICCDPSLIYEDYIGGSAKREACLDLISTAIEGGHRMLVFSQFTSMLALLEKDLQNAGIEYYKIIGATPKQERLNLVNAFNSGSVPVFLISLKAGGTGLNLTGADIVIHYDPWWNAAVQNQATDRAHRIGQTKPVTVYKLIVSGSIEDKILEMQERKLQLADDILSGEAASLGSLSRDELLALI